MNTRRYLLHGDPCQGHGCANRAVKQSADIDGLCARCWLGASQHQRTSAALEALLTDPPALAARARRDAERDMMLEALWAL